jgi:hypothetical protein
MEFYVFNRVLLADDLVRVSRPFTLLFQIRVNYVAYVLLVFQPLIAIYGYFFISLPFVVMSFGNGLVVKVFQYFTLQMPTPGTQKRIPDTFDYVLFY